jgi:uncharacterized membrane protein YdjX (TVP38/TMEM64 family)
VGERRGDRWATVRAVLLAALVVAIGGVLWCWREPLRALLGDQARIREWVGGFGAWGPLVSIALNVAQVVFAPIPGQFVGLANGYLYGVWLGTLYSMAGLVLGTTLAMALGRCFGRPVVERLVSAERLARWDGIAGRQGPLFFFLVFLFPLVPDDIACFLIGLSPLSIPRMLVLTTLGRLPGVFVSCWVGAYATALPWWAWLPLAGVTAGLAWLFWRNQARIEGLIARLIQRLVRRGSVIARRLARCRSRAAPGSCGAREES